MMICDRRELVPAIAALRGDGVAAVDTEFVWERTYWPVLGIVQFGAADGRAWVLDALSDADPTPVRELLEDPATVKILHDARQDLALLGRYCGASPRTVFDTRIAAGFAGFPSTISLQQLLREALGVELPKTETRTDWCRRPLSDAQTEYARDDVRHLGNLRLELLRRAGERGASAWLAEEMAPFDDPATYRDRPPEDAWTRVKGAGRLTPSGRAVLRALAAWREREAISRNLPRAWILPDEGLVALSLNPPKDPDDLRSRKILPAGLAATVEAVAELATRAAATPPADCPPPASARVDDVTKRRADGILELLRKRGTELGIDPALLGSRAQVTALVQDPEDPGHPLARGWRFDVAGRDLLQRLRG